jgi:hypothetical protein
MFDSDHERRGPNELVDDEPVRFSLRSLMIAVAIIAVLLASTQAGGPVGFVLALAAIGIVACLSARRPLSAFGVFVFTCFLLVILTSLLRVPATTPVCINNLRNLGFALRSYETATDSFPPVCTLDARGQPLTSWRTLILPNLERTDMFAAYHRDQPWNSKVNKDVTDAAIPFLHCPSDSTLKPSSNLTSYVAIVSPGGA